VAAHDVDRWTRVCAVSDASSREGTVLDVDPPVALWNIDGQFYATDDTCTHEKYSLSDGYLDGCQAECALHWAKFDVRTGEALSLPATEALRTYPVMVEDECVFVDLTSRG
jgi:3-phenylpropionate/trans-cinnamate dioxygenase ferredoxin subunit